ncbi:hypothetical protein IP84_02455 [beta proteobacterium AAP99]|nr:hypothetical protein IP84_02455 [beta proteobacterium AAP99]
MVLPDAWTRCFAVQTPRGARGSADLDAAIRLRFEHLYGDDPQTWWFDAQPDLKERFLVAAMPAALGQAVLDMATGQGLRLESVSPAILHAWQQLAKAKRTGLGWWVLREVDSTGRRAHVRLIGRSAAGWFSLDQDVGGEVPWDTPHDARGWLLRTAVALGEPVPTRVHVLHSGPSPIGRRTPAHLYAVRIEGQDVSWMTDEPIESVSAGSTPQHPNPGVGPRAPVAG